MEGGPRCQLSNEKEAVRVVNRVPIQEEECIYAKELLMLRCACQKTLSEDKVEPNGKSGPIEL